MSYPRFLYDNLYVFCYIVYGVFARVVLNYTRGRILAEISIMQTAVFSTEFIKKEITIQNGSFIRSRYVNLRTGETVNILREFVIVYRENGKRIKRRLTSKDCRVSVEDEKIVFKARGFLIEEKHEARDCGVLEKRLSVKAPQGTFIEKIVQEEIRTDKKKFCWSAPLAGRTFVSAKVARLGQPVYVNDMFFGQESPVGDNFIRSCKAEFVYHTGRTFEEVEKDSGYSLPPFIAGAGKKADMNALKQDFFDYLYTVIRRPRFRVQFNSWYDNKLNISSDKIEKSFTAIAEGFAKAGFGSLDCYVVDDGWTEYTKPLFWEFNDKFKGGFAKEAELTRKLDSKFGVWFGPRGGYTSQTYEYAKLLETIGYHVNKRSRDICTADERYVDALCSKMADFCRLYNTDYFKIDGFAYAPCRQKGHNHPAAKGDGLAFYTFLWEKWMKGFEKVREANPDVCLNVTSYAHCSPWFLTEADYIWMNNASDMDFVGKGSDMQQCLNYRDGRYRDLFIKRQYQFPAAYLYNHEPTYAFGNCKYVLGVPTNKPVIYTDEEFSLYLKCCFMRGSGLAELYFSPGMMSEEKWKSAAKEIDYARKHFDLLGRSEFFGGRPERGEVYGYIAHKDGKYILMIRNSGNKSRGYSFDLPVAGHMEGVLGPQQIRFESNSD